MITCYECEQHAPLIYKSRCGECVIRRLKFNENENDELRAQGADQRVKIDQLLAYNANLKATLDKLVD